MFLLTHNLFLDLSAFFGFNVLKYICLKHFSPHLHLKTTVAYSTELCVIKDLKSHKCIHFNAVAVSSPKRFGMSHVMALMFNHNPKQKASSHVF